MISVTPEAKCLKPVTLGGVMVTFGVLGPRRGSFLPHSSAQGEGVLFLAVRLLGESPLGMVDSQLGFSLTGGTFC